MLDPIDYWRFHKEFTVVEAALLILDLNPSELKHSVLTNTKKPENFDAVFSGITKAIINNKLKANIRYTISWMGNNDNSSWIEYPNYDEVVGYCVDEHLSKEPLEVHFKKTPDWQNTLIELDDLKTWLTSSKLKPKFFFSDSNPNTPEYLDKYHPRYSEKLAACINTWVALGDQSLTNGKSVKSAIDSYLIKNSQEFGLVHKKDDPKHTYEKGDIIEGAKNEMTKIINWNPNGGATRTPEINKPTPQDTEPTPQLKHVDIIKDFDNIPF